MITMSNFCVECYTGYDLWAGLGLIDTIMAGHLSATDLAAIAVGVGLWIPVMLLFSGIMIGDYCWPDFAAVASDFTNLRCTGKLAA